MNPMRWLAIRLGSQPWLPRFASFIVGRDLLLRRLSRGRFTLLTVTGLPELYLSVPGRRTGVVHTTPLLCVPHEGSWLVAGSNWGGPTPPAWTFNLETAGEAVVEFKGVDHPITASLVEGEERARLWQIMLRTWPNYAKYAARTPREIKVFRLTPLP